MKKTNLNQALQELKQAKNLAQRLAATSKLVNQTAYKAGQFLYGTTESTHKEPPITKTQPISEIESQQTSVSAPDLASDLAKTEEDTAQPSLKKEVDYFTKGLMQLNEELKALRIAKELAHTDVESHAIHFKILRLERERQKYLAQREI